MEVKIIKCPKCGEFLEVEDGLDSFFCKYCGNQITICDVSNTVSEAKTDVLYNKPEDNRNYKNKKVSKDGGWSKSKKLVVTLLLSISGGMMALGLLFGYIVPSAKHSSKIKELNGLSDQIEEYVKEGDYDSALLLTNKLRLNDSWSSDESKEWDDRREEYVRQIEIAKSKIDSSNNNDTENLTTSKNEPVSQMQEKPKVEPKPDPVETQEKEETEKKDDVGQNSKSYGTGTGSKQEQVSSQTDEYGWGNTDNTPDPAPATSSSNICYVTPKGKKYHFSAACAGDNAIQTTVEDAVSSGKGPCAKCAQ